MTDSRFILQSEAIVKLVEIHFVNLQNCTFDKVTQLKELQPRTRELDQILHKNSIKPKDKKPVQIF